MTVFALKLESFNHVTDRDVKCEVLNEVGHWHCFEDLEV